MNTHESRKRYLVFSDRPTLEVCTIGHNPPSPLWDTPRRTIADYEIVLVRTGRVEYEVGGRTLILNAGEAGLFLPRVTHAARPGQRFDMYFFHFEGTHIPATVTRARALALLRPPAKTPAPGTNDSYILPQMRQDQIVLQEKMAMGSWQEEIITLMRMGLRERSKPSLNSYRRLSLCLLQILQLLARETMRELGIAGAPPGGGNWTLVQQALFLIRERAARGLSVNLLAQELRTTPQTLMRQFRQCLGKSPLTCLHEMRLVTARELMRNPGLSLKEIAFATGFRSLAEFSRWFRRQEQTSPSEYRLRIACET